MRVLRFDMKSNMEELRWPTSNHRFVASCRIEMLHRDVSSCRHFFRQCGRDLIGQHRKTQINDYVSLFMTCCDVATQVKSSAFIEIVA